MNKNNLQSPLALEYADPIGNNSAYKSPQLKSDALSAMLPTLMFYTRLCVPVAALSYKALRGIDDVYAWVKGSHGSFKALEKTNCKFDITGLNNINDVDGPCVFVANHMSTLETFILPCIIQPRKHFVFVVKESLLRVPFFGNILKSRNPIIVSRKNPRQDLKTILEQGKEHLSQGTSIMIFPQSTRGLDFNPEKFNSIGAKLAKRSDVPLLPLALKTNAWGQGKYIKDFGLVNPKLTIYFDFGKSIIADDNSKTAHNYTCNYITSALKKWNHGV